MRLVLWVLALFATAVAVTLVAKNITGHATLVMPPYETIELSLDIFIAWLLAAFFAFYILVRLALRVFGYRHRKAENMLFSGVKAYFEGDYAHARRRAATALRLSDSSTSKAISAVIAARSAHKLTEMPLRDEYLATAEKEAPDERTLAIDHPNGVAT